MSVKHIKLILSPYHVGIRGHEVGAGPGFLLDRGLKQSLKECEVREKIEEIGPVNDFEGEIGRSFEVVRRVSKAVASTSAGDDLPLLLAGNCNNEVGMVAGFDDKDLELIWFDAHTDYDTPDEATSGYFDGQGVSMLMGQSWHALMRTVPGHRDFDKDKVVFVGVRDLSDDQWTKLRASQIRAVCGGRETQQGKYAEKLQEELEKSTAKRCIVHLDVDCLDTSIGVANKYAASGGLLAQDLFDCFEVILRDRKVVGMTISSFDPNFDGADALAEVVIRATRQLLS